MNQLKVTFQELAEKAVKLARGKRKHGVVTKPEGRLSECGKYVVLKISKGRETIIDIDDFEKVAAYRWKASMSSCRCYAKRTCRNGKNKSRVLAMHRFIMDAQPGTFLDHINGDSLDNRKENLRFCSLCENQRAVRKNYKGSSSKYRGVSWDTKNKRWSARICFNYKTYHIGQFKNEEEAAKARDKKALEMFGPIAHLNFPKLH